MVCRTFTTITNKKKNELLNFQVNRRIRTPQYNHSINWHFLLRNWNVCQRPTENDQNEQQEKKKLSQFHSLGCAISSSFPFFFILLSIASLTAAFSVFILCLSSIPQESFIHRSIRHHLLLRLFTVFTCDHACHELATNSIWFSDSKIRLK